MGYRDTGNLIGDLQQEKQREATNWWVETAEETHSIYFHHLFFLTKRKKNFFLLYMQCTRLPVFLFLLSYRLPTILFSIWTFIFFFFGRSPTHGERKNRFVLRGIVIKDNNGQPHTKRQGNNNKPKKYEKNLCQEIWWFLFLFDITHKFPAVCVLLLFLSRFLLFF